MKTIFFFLLGITIVLAAVTGWFFESSSLAFVFYFYALVFSILALSAFSISWICVHRYKMPSKQKNPVDFLNLLKLFLFGVIFFLVGALIYPYCEGAPHQETLMVIGGSVAGLFAMILIVFHGSAFVLGLFEKLFTLKQKQAPKVQAKA